MNQLQHEHWQGKRLVAFGCGYVGSAVARHAVVRGAQVTALTRNAAKAEALRAEGMDVIVADLADDGWHSQIAGGADFVLNCVSSGGGGVDGYRRSYVDGMASIGRWATAVGGIGTLVYISSTGVYPQSGGETVTENSPTGGDEFAQTLLEAEGRLRESMAAKRWIVLRLAGIYGPGRHYLLNQVRAGEVAGSGGHRLNLAHRDDIVAAVRACFDAPSGVANEIFNVADEGPASKREVADWLAVRLGLPPPRFTGEAAGGRRAVTPDRIIANGKLKSTLGWKPHYPTFREGYEKLLSR